MGARLIINYVVVHTYNVYAYFLWFRSYQSISGKNTKFIVCKNQVLAFKTFSTEKHYFIIA